MYASKRPDDEQATRNRAPEMLHVPVVDEANWNTVHEGMRRVVHGVRGTARAIAPESGMQMAGKSGTAQVAAQDRDEDMDENTAAHLRHHALFVAYAPFENPEIVVAAVVEHGGGGSAEAAPVARATIDAWLGQGVRP